VRYFRRRQQATTLEALQHRSGAKHDGDSEGEVRAAASSETRVVRGHYGRLRGVSERTRRRVRFGSV